MRGDPAALIDFDRHYLEALFEVFTDQFVGWALKGGNVLSRDQLVDVARDAVTAVRDGLLSPRSDPKEEARRQRNLRGAEKLKDYVLGTCWKKAKRSAGQIAGQHRSHRQLFPDDAKIEHDFLDQLQAATRVVALLVRRLFQAAAELEGKRARYFDYSVDAFPDLKEIHISGYTAIAKGKRIPYAEVAKARGVSEDTVSRAVKWFRSWTRDVAKGIRYEGDERLHWGDVDLLNSLLPDNAAGRPS